MVGITRFYNVIKNHAAELKTITIETYNMLKVISELDILIRFRVS